MNLYLLVQDQNEGYDTYDSAVVCAEDEDKARIIHPYTNVDADFDPWKDRWCSDTWASSPDRVTVKLIGVAVEGTEAGVILASFNAG